MKARRTAAIQISECGASELDAVEDILCEVGSCRPVIDDEFVMTDLGEIRKVLDQFGDTKMTAIPLFKKAIEEVKQIARDNNVDKDNVRIAALGNIICVEEEIELDD